MTLADYFSTKTPVPSELRTREWDLLPAAQRERAFFSAAVDRAEVLDDLFEVSRQRAEGKISAAEARRLGREALAKRGYEPAPGTEGTIKDLRSVRRLTVIYETNSAMAHGWKSYMKQQDALEMFPAQRLVRLRRAQAPRDWPRRWREGISKTFQSGATKGGAAEAADFVALVNHPLWTALSRFGLPYPPFDFGSGMGVEPVGRAEAEALGLLPREIVEDTNLLQPDLRGFNQDLSLLPHIRHEDTWRKLEKELKGFAVRDGKRLVFTDPNGVRPYDAASLRNVIAAPLPPGFPHLQRDALDAYLANPDKFHIPRPWTDEAQDLGRLVFRCKPVADPLQHGSEFYAVVEKGAAATNRPLTPVLPHLPRGPLPPGRVVVKLDAAAVAQLRDLRPVTGRRGNALLCLPGGVPVGGAHTPAPAAGQTFTLTDLQREFAALQAATTDAFRLRDLSRELVQVPVAERRAVTLTMKTRVKEIQQRAKAGADAFSALVRPDLVPQQIHVQATRSGRAFARAADRSINLSSSTSLQTVVHELAHHLEFLHPSILQEAIAFRASRTAGETPQPLRRLTGVRGYAAHEIALEDEWQRRGGHHYSGKIYAGNHATEIITMGMERLWQNPLEFWLQDRSFCEFILRVVRGIQ